MMSKFEEPPMQKSEIPSKCSDKEVSQLIEKYREQGLKEKDEYFYVEDPEEKRTTYVHKFKKIPHKREDGTIEYEGIEKHLRALLGLEGEDK